MQQVVEPEELTEEKKKATCLSVNRILLGITCGALIMSFFFSFWDAAVNGVGPVIGILIFQIIRLGGLSFIVYNTKFLQPSFYLIE